MVFGISLVANFQVSCQLVIVLCLYGFQISYQCVFSLQETSVLWVHISGALLTFIGGLLFCILHTIISYRMFPLYNGKRIVLIRLFVTTLLLISTVTGESASDNSCRFQILFLFLFSYNMCRKGE